MNEMEWKSDEYRNILTVRYILTDPNVWIKYTYYLTLETICD